MQAVPSCIKLPAMPLDGRVHEAAATLGLFRCKRVSRSTSNRWKHPLLLSMRAKCLLAQMRHRTYTKIHPEIYALQVMQAAAYTRKDSV